MYLKLPLHLSLPLLLSFYWSGHVSPSLWSKVSKIALWRFSLNVFVIVFVFVFVIVFLLVRSCFFHHSDQMSQRSTVSKIDVIVFVIVFVFVFVFVVVFLLVRSCFLMVPISFAKLGFGLEDQKALNPTQWVSEWVNEWGRPRAARAVKNWLTYLGNA